MGQSAVAEHCAETGYLRTLLCVSTSTLTGLAEFLIFLLTKPDTNVGKTIPEVVFVLPTLAMKAFVLISIYLPFNFYKCCCFQSTTSKNILNSFRNLNSVYKGSNICLINYEKKHCNYSKIFRGTIKFNQNILEMYPINIHHLYYQSVVNSSIVSKNDIFI